MSRRGPSAPRGGTATATPAAADAVPCARAACYALDIDGDGAWGSSDWVELGQTCQEDSLLECVPTLPWTDSPTGTLVYAFAEIGWDDDGVPCSEVVSCDDRPLAYGSVDDLLAGQVATMDVLAGEQASATAAAM